jgi:hypothetical protein
MSPRRIDGPWERHGSAVEPAYGILAGTWSADLVLEGPTIEDEFQFLLIDPELVIDLSASPLRIWRKFHMIPVSPYVTAGTLRAGSEVFFVCSFSSLPGTTCTH